MFSAGGNEMCPSGSGVCWAETAQMGWAGKSSHTCTDLPTCFKIRRTQREASVPCSPDGLTPASIFFCFHWGNHKAFFSSPIPLHLWKNNCHLTRCPQNSAPCKAEGHSVGWWQPHVTKGSTRAGQDVSTGMAVCVCTDVPMQGWSSTPCCWRSAAGQSWPLWLPTLAHVLSSLSCLQHFFRITEMWMFELCQQHTLSDLQGN